MRYVCAKCGGGAVHVNAGRPSIDPRFAIGRCDTCDTVRTLIADDDLGRRQIAERDQRNREKRLVARVRRGDYPKGPKGDAMVAEAAAIQERWHDQLHPVKENS